MNALVRLWNIIAGIGESLARTKELIDLGNARMEQSLGLTEEPLKIGHDVTPSKKDKK